MSNQTKSLTCFDETWARKWLEVNGWLESVAGEVDFSKAATAISLWASKPPIGLLITGRAGVGKTMLCQILFEKLRTEKVRIDCSDNSSVDFLVHESDAGSNGGVYNSTVDDYMNRTVMIDDLGTEEIRTSYGNQLDRVGKFIVRYHQRGTGRLMMTTNLTGSEMMSRYGARVVDRIMDKCVVLALTGKSKRQVNVI